MACLGQAGGRLSSSSGPRARGPPPPPPPVLRLVIAATGAGVRAALSHQVRRRWAGPRRRGARRLRLVVYGSPSPMRCRSRRDQRACARVEQHAVAAKSHASARSALGVKQAFAGVPERGSRSASRTSMRAHAGRERRRLAQHFLKFRCGQLGSVPETALGRAPFGSASLAPCVASGTLAARFVPCPGSRRPLHVRSSPTPPHRGNRRARSPAPGIPTRAACAASPEPRARKRA